MTDESKGPAPIYVSWATFKNAIEGFTQGIPNQVDRTVYPGLSWAVQSALLAGFRFFGLIDDKGKPTVVLPGLAVSDETQRKAALEKLLREKYAKIFALDLVKTTPGQLNEEWSKVFGVSGDTREKGIRFFLTAAEYVGVPLSVLFKTKGGGTGSPSVGTPRKRRAQNRTRAADGDGNGEREDSLPPASGTEKTIALRSGGSLTLSATLQLFSLTQADRTFIFDLIDKLEAYELGDEAKVSDK